MRQAYLDGVLDPDQARPLDRNWWRRVRWTLEHVENRNALEVYRLRHALHASAFSYEAAELQAQAGVGDAHDKMVEAHWEPAVAIQNAVQKLLLPWMDPEAGRRGAFRDMKDAYVRLFGDPEDPEFQRQMYDGIATMLREAAEARRAQGV